MVGILPRRGNLEWVATTNSKIKAMVDNEDNCVYIDPGVKMLNADGTLNESLFTDGLHPNDDGYSIIVDDIISK